MTHSDKEDNPPGGAADGSMWGLRAARLFDGVTLRPGRPLVVIRAGRIVDVDLSGIRPSADLHVVDLGDVTLLPGLVDSHVHLAFDPHGHPFEQLRQEDDATVLDRMRTHARQALRAGITTVRDLGDRNYLGLSLRAEYESGADVGPELLLAGPPITRTGGHCWFLGGEADGVDGVRAAVAERVARGMDAIKVMATGGVLTPGWSPFESQYGLAELRAVVETAHEAGRPVCAHAHSGGGIADAVAAGVDVIEHGFFLRLHDGQGDAEPDWRTVAAMVEAGVLVSTTTARRPEEKMPALVAKVRDNFGKMQREGLRLVCSSDAGVGPLKTHDCLPYGVIDFGALLGFAHAEAIAAATSVAAQACGVADRKGRVAPGYDADVLAVAGNPLERLEALLEVRAVFRAGRRVR
ncbi:hypothetical protein GCM10012275_57210 [Longimycelium tulufanense]|uniref:Amidohydrolase-related domain-containing protein n=1 Tax=Longimycelium tulufanense TaxID=907463 RepID=A0A8J3CK23_9PSEU|nr:amidohydrolase family protein [Longimycelium tulufanense]GGM79163.1 hypothetical protein GCM10012275_57210 [Longimycelium tulufanense]